ncbi:UbiH/UbiF/VisC/COQ6 family ubiquinone biosynthesis hydroxylase [Solimonas terrae]|uniref:UbiH/UbiF/VisC/COQ6 family ubiquinone biosynthesis hydroxylase n=1 Tax=Solimonas terrae TaxID=1396819 RepID=A0A6M2BQN8_9GAMM|nr:UbiH/UbiF/VisC/COQ6 family ubiquinone biosynthesis hydroxylase [Solimonas terrae]NGY04610.1 UbiH/UbiF/VisC/COQ6 family ubiquinone biosynthesis hydroxylase [Solimonas terrae]
MTVDCDVAIVGGGPVGAAVAVGLAQRGLAVQLLDRGQGPTPRVLADGDDYDLRVYALAPSCIAFLDRLGAWSRIAATRSSPYQGMRVWENDPQSPLCFDARDVRAATLGHIVESGLLASALWAQLPVSGLRTGVQVVRIDAGEHDATLHTDDGGSLRTRLAVIAEGRDSRLRTQLGIESLGGQYEQTAVVCHIRSEQAHGGIAWQRFLPTGPLALLPLADGRASIVWSSGEAAALLALDDADFCRALGDASQHVLGRITACSRRVQFALTLQHADRYVGNGVALVGDAAHVVHPLAGQGVNLGFADAEALTDVVAEARAAGRNFASLRVLKRYERARRADVIDMLAVTDGLYRAFRMPLPGLAALRSRGLAVVNAAAPLRRELVRRAIGLR